MKIYRGSCELEFKSWSFPGGERGIKFNAEDHRFKGTGYDPKTPTTIVLRATNSDSLIDAGLAKNALETLNLGPVELFIPYLPYARQDRVCVPGESFSIRVYVDLLAALNFSRVTVVDPHSAISEALLGIKMNRVDIISQFDVIQKFEEFKQRVMQGNCVFVAPDAGSEKKTAKIADYFGHREIVNSRKVRNLQNGNIIETVIYCDDLEGKDVVIADDICDGGRTYTEMVPLLRAKGAGKVVLYVTHGIFSKGLPALAAGGIDELFTTTSFHTKDELIGMVVGGSDRTEITPSPKLHILPIELLY